MRLDCPGVITPLTLTEAASFYGYKMMEEKEYSFCFSVVFCC